jgi:NADPH-dependent ferric siderophore reductase
MDASHAERDCANDQPLVVETALPTILEMLETKTEVLTDKSYENPETTPEILDNSLRTLDEKFATYLVTVETAPPTMREMLEKKAEVLTEESYETPETTPEILDNSLRTLDEKLATYLLIVEAAPPTILEILEKKTEVLTDKS